MPRTILLLLRIPYDTGRAFWRACCDVGRCPSDEEMARILARWEQDA